jgi:hypothetical protein
MSLSWIPLARGLGFISAIMNHVGIGFILKKSDFLLEKGIGPEKYICLSSIMIHV